MKICAATGNAGKLRELRRILEAQGHEVVSQKELGITIEPEETGTTFEENALIKARAVAALTGLVSVADDSGLEVDALGGAPGVYSARYSDDWESLPDEGRDARNIRKLLHAMTAVPAEKRACRFVCCMAAVKPNGEELVVRGTWDGTLLESRRGDNGFGYDPVFFDASSGKSAAQLTRDEKNARSHRGNALRALLARWAEFVQ